MKTTFNWEGFLITLVILFVAILLIIVYTIPVKMANKRGRSGFGWFMFSFFFSPLLGMLFLALLGETDDRRRERIIEEEEFRNRTLNKSTSEMKKCPQCAELIKEEATVCRYCGNVKPNIIQSDSDISRLEEWKKNNPNESLNDYYKNLEKNRINIPSIVNIPPPPFIESQIIKKNLFYDRLMLKLLIICLVIIALFRYEYIGNKIKQAGTFIVEKINGIKDPDGFNETSFDSREAEIKYIREYVNYKIRLLVESQLATAKNDLKPDEASANYISIFSSVLIKQFTDLYTEKIMNEVVSQNLSVTQVKERLKNVNLQKELNGNVHNGTPNKNEINNYKEKVKPAERYYNGLGKLETLNKIISDCYMQNSKNDLPEYSVRGSMYLDKEKKTVTGEFNIMTEVVEENFNNREKVFTIISWTYFIKDKGGNKIFISKAPMVTHAKDLHDAQEIIDLVTEDSKDIVAKKLGKISEEVEFHEGYSSGGC